MDHAEFRRLFGANPKRTEPEVLEHRASCPGCAKYAADMQRIDQWVLGALDVPAPASGPKPWEVRRRTPWLAMAASVLVVIAVAATWWTGHRREELIVEVVKHADRERDVLVVSDKRVAEDKVQHTMEKAGAHMLGSLPFSIARTSSRMAMRASQKRSSSALGSLSVGSIIKVPATGKLTVGAWNP